MSFSVFRIFFEGVGGSTQNKPPEKKLPKINLENQPFSIPTPSKKKKFSIVFKKLSGYRELTMRAFDCRWVFEKKLKSSRVRFFFGLIFGDFWKYRFSKKYFWKQFWKCSKIQNHKNSTDLNSSHRELSFAVEKMKKYWKVKKLGGKIFF